MEALSLANAIRVARAALKREISAGITDVCEVLADPPLHTLSMKVFDLLMARNKFGYVKVSRLLNTCRISQAKTIGGLTLRQRIELMQLIMDRHPSQAAA